MNKYETILNANKPENLTHSILKKLAQWYPAQLVEYTERNGSETYALRDENTAETTYNLNGFTVIVVLLFGELQSIKVK